MLAFPTQAGVPRNQTPFSPNIHSTPGGPMHMQNIYGGSIISVGSEHYVSILSFVDKDQLEQVQVEHGCSVLLNHKVHAVGH